MRILKRDKRIENFNIEKFHRFIQYACEGITGVSISSLELKVRDQLFDKMTSEQLVECCIRASADMITEDTVNYQFVASRLVNYHLRKQVYGQPEPSRLYDHVRKVIDLGYYTPELTDLFTESDFDILDTYVNHSRDFNIAYVGMEQFRGKYLLKNRTNGKIFETPQMAFILIAALLFAKYPKETRMKWIKKYYDATSTFDISLPTPIMAGLRSPQKQFSSCVLIETADSLDSINATASAVVKYASQKAGIGIGLGSIRAIGSPVRNGDTSHTGVTPFIKYFQSAVKSCNQGGVRSSSCTTYYPCWHYEVEDLLVLKNNKGVDDNRARHLDYGVQFNRLFYERLINNENITLFSPHDVPDVYNAFFADQAKFKELYEKAESNGKIRKKSIKALDLFSSFIQERKDTGRIYLMNVDHVNEHGSFFDPIRMSNLCCEITLPTKPLNQIDDEAGRIALCTLSAINWGKIREPSDFELPCQLAVRGLDALLDYQRYPVKAAEFATMNYRPLGIGIINLAYWMAKNDIPYDDINGEGLQKIHQYAEAWSYYLIKASIDLAKEFGNPNDCGGIKYSKGILPIDTYKKELDVLVKPVYEMDWKTLRADLGKYGIRNATLMACMPAETSASVSNSTNGIEPPRSLISIKQSKDGVLKQVVPEYRRLKNKYDLLWDQKSPVGYIKICAVLQKFMDQAISVNTSYNPKFYPDEKIPMSEMINHLLLHYRLGGKTLYYCNVLDGAGEIEVEHKIADVEESQDDCDSCKL